MTHESANWNGEGKAKKVEVVQKLLILSGLPGSGKTRFAGQWVDEAPAMRGRINYDDLRLKMYGRDWRFNRKEEDAMKAEAVGRFHDLVHLGADIVIDNCNLTPRARGVWENLAKGYAMEVELIDFDTPVATCIKNDATREGRARVGRAVIERMALFNGYLDFSDRTLYPRDFIIVDMDGTISNCDARRKVAFEGPTVHKQIKHHEAPGIGTITMDCPQKDVVTDKYCNACGGSAKRNWPLFYKGVENDPVIEPISRLVRILTNEYDILVVSGRPTDDAGLGTDQFLRNRGWYANVKHLFMRQGGDYRPDFIIKEEILECLPKERIKYVLDDRQQVVDMWRKNGLTCLQVADGQF